MALTLHSQNIEMYSTPRTVTLGDKKYNNIQIVDSRDFTDNDGKRKLVSYLDGTSADYVSYIENGKMTRYEKRYHNPVSRNIGGKEYNNIVSKIIKPDVSKAYEIFTPNGYFNIIEIKNNGEIIDHNALAKQRMKEALSKPFKSLGNLFKKMMPKVKI